ncbi:MAG: glycosyltransferase family 47 protein [Xanthobacteraceae bacterium]|nr:glycosyltransferase family 47 protein [Xanthobacteraceae bacterium]
MKIFVLTVPPNAQPQTQKYRYPAGNDDYEIEQQFNDWLKSHPSLTVSDPHSADFHYLPIFWTRYHVHHDYGKTGQSELQSIVSAAIVDDSKTFTVCQYDDGPLADVGRTIVFYASRNAIDGIDVPLLRAAHRMPLWRPKKRYLASFMGRLSSHPLRQAMADALKNREDVLLLDGNEGPRRFVRATLASYICLAPRGYGGSSFRAFEAMQLGVVPLIIGDLDTRPFKRHIDWSTCSLFTSDPRTLPKILDQCDKRTLLELSRHASDVYRTYFANLRWCPYVIAELEERF